MLLEKNGERTRRCSSPEYRDESEGWVLGAAVQREPHLAIDPTPYAGATDVQNKSRGLLEHCLESLHPTIPRYEVLDIKPDVNSRLPQRLGKLPSCLRILAGMAEKRLPTG
jgi:hypothetical protein